MKRCPICFTRFEAAEFEGHLTAHGLDPWILKQRAAQVAWFATNPGRHKPSEPCNCSFYGVRNVCEALQLEAA